MTEAEVRQLIDAKAEDLAQNVVVDWRARAASETWLSLPPEMQFDDLPNVIRAVSVASLKPVFERPDCQSIVELSARHGDHRSEEGFQEGFIHTEYYLLRQSLWQLMRELLDPAAALRCITRVDAAISLATMAALRGFHCRTFTARGEWPQARDRLLDEWPLVGQ